jgi:two-component system, LuxR family, response regulator FixJ
LSGTSTVYVIDDDVAVCRTIATILASQEITAVTFSSALEFLELTKSLKPGCVVSDVRMPGLDGMTLLERLGDLNFDFPVVLITAHGDIRMAVRAMQYGAVDFIEKPFDNEALIAVVRKAQRLLERGKFAREKPGDKSRLAKLSERERQVFDRLVAGQSNKVIAHELSVSPRTVEFHRSNIMEKLQAENLAELVRIGLSEAGHGIETDSSPAGEVPVPSRGKSDDGKSKQAED